MIRYPITFVPNESDDLHCFQSAVRMAWQGLSGQKLSLIEAERLTGFDPDQQTWPFAGMLAFADSGFIVRSIEDFDPEQFVRNPAAEIRRQTANDKITAHILESSNVDQQKSLVTTCLETVNISFEPRVPGFHDLCKTASRPGTAVICNVNYKALMGQPGYNGHFVLVDQADSDSVLIQNPGLPAIKDQKVTARQFRSAWCEPNKSMANILAIAAPT